nr:proline racemase family protein [Streptomyces hydrogenans]
MYGGFVVPPDDDGAHLGVLFWHKDGFSTACGHGTIALAAWAVDSGLVPAGDGDRDVPVRVDVPSGRVTATVHRSGGRTTGVTFRNVPARVTARKVPVATGLGIVEVDLATPAPATPPSPPASSASPWTRRPCPNSPGWGGRSAPRWPATRPPGTPTGRCSPGCTA